MEEFEEKLLTDEEVEFCCTMADLVGVMLFLFGLLSILGSEKNVFITTIIFLSKKLVSLSFFVYLCNQILLVTP